MDDVDQIKLVKLLLEGSALIQEARPGSQVAALFKRGVETYMQGNFTLDTCLSLIPEPGKHHPATQWRLFHRDKHILRAYGECVGDSPWQRAIELEKQIDNFADNFWPSIKNKAKPPSEYSKLQCELFYIFKFSGDDYPPKARQLSNIVKAARVACYTDF